MSDYGLPFGEPEVRRCSVCDADNPKWVHTFDTGRKTFFCSKCAGDANVSDLFRTDGVLF